MHKTTRSIELNGQTTACWFPHSWINQGQALATITGAANAAPGTTFTTSAPHGYSVGDTITIAGTASYNGTHEITAVPSNTEFTIAATFVADESGTSAYYELYLGTGIVTQLSVDYWDASGTNELLVRVFDQAPYRDPQQAYRQASYNSDTGLYIAGGTAVFQNPTGAVAVDGDQDVVEVTTGTGASVWREGLAVIGSPANTDPIRLASFRLGPNSTGEDKSLIAECLGGIAIEFAGVATGGSLGAVDHINATVTFVALSDGGNRYNAVTNPALTQTVPSAI